MKQGIHPDYKKAKVTCGCGNVIETYNTVGDLSVEICSACHPFFTGKQKLVDTAGRVDKFRAKMEKAQSIKKSQVKSQKPVETKEKTDRQKDLEKLKATLESKEVKELDEKVEEIKEEFKEETVDLKPEEKESDSAEN